MKLTADNFQYVRELVRKRSAVVLEREKLYLAESRLLPLAWREGFESVDEFVTRLRLLLNSALQLKVVEAMTTNETSFFRDVQPFETLRKVILPELMERRARQRSLNIWSAVCSSGQEPYSVALLLHEHFPALSGWNVKLIASDLSNEMIERARAGRYGQLEVNRGLPATLLVKYFRRSGVEWQISDNVRRMVEFRQINLVDNWPSLPLMDVIFLRNVLIYFDVPTKKVVLSKVRRLLRPDGYLFLGGSETTLTLDDAFERVPFERSTSCYRLRAETKPAAGAVETAPALVGFLAQTP